ncbi:MAG: NADH-quinone oxidoreductase subunit L [Candidatus Omnitrophica bacterium]|nr:NADH-quinone oxidoreductase subunit L [Candidatus Omnitrophota bacterium]
MDLALLWTIQLSGLAAFLLIQLLPRSAKKIAPAIGIALSFLAAAASAKLLLDHANGFGLPVQFSHPWLAVSDRAVWPNIPVERYALFVGFLLDPLNLTMITLVTSISFFVQLFSFYYMNEDRSRARYFGFLSFFSFSMTGLVLSNNLLQTFLFWELVGLTSYLLIGFWYEKESAATAARKAFVVNRLADLGFYLGIILVLILFGSLNFTDLKSQALAQVLPPATLTLVGVLVFLGVMGKSAQFPFHVWLPDAMEGPTPVSALIHSATMVAAGVFLLHRAFDLFSASATTLLVILSVGCLTALTGAALATIQRDMKRILAYSTVSQLGLMTMAVGAGSSTAGFFHLSTHAYFKSLLFLTSGVFIHRFHTNDIWEIGQKGGKNDRLAIGFLAFGLLSLSGLPPLAGFFSKDLILEAIKEKNLFFYSGALFVSFLTAYYSFRMFLVIARGRIRREERPHAESRALKISRNVPLLCLATLSLVAAFLGMPSFHFNFEMLLTTAAILVSGGGLAILRFRDPEAAEQKLLAGKTFMQKILERKFFIDDAYEFLVKKVGLAIAHALNRFDRTVINGLMVNETSFSVMRLGRLAALLQNGALQDYLAWAMTGGVLILFAFLHFYRGTP